MKRTVIVLLLFALMGAGLSALTPEEVQDRFEAVVLLRQEGLGTGMVVDSEGYILTAYHVVGGEGPIWVYFLNEEERVRARYVYGDKNLDIAILKVERKSLKTVTFGKPSYIGEPLYSLGHPIGFGWHLTKGILSSVRVDLKTGLRYLTTDTSIYSGNSGGPLFNEKGEVIGMITSMLGPLLYAPIPIPIPIHISFALHVEVLKPAVEVVVKIDKILQENKE